MWVTEYSVSQGKDYFLSKVYPETNKINIPILSILLGSDSHLFQSNVLKIRVMDRLGPSSGCKGIKQMPKRRERESTQAPNKKQIETPAPPKNLLFEV